MGRPLKIKQSTTIDIGFNSFANLDPRTQVIPVGMSSSEFLGVVGGANASIATSTYPVVYANANVAGVSGDAYIITQKGQTKYLVGINTAIQDENIVKGNTYKITSVSNTNWQLLGAPITATVGDIFTAIKNGTGLTTNGVVQIVGVCSLVDSDTPNAGEMQVIASCNSGSFNVSKMTNKYVWDYQTPAVKYAANFFDGASGLVATAASGADVPTWDNGSGNYALAEVTDYTS